jgi:hypothetical protein
MKRSILACSGLFAALATSLPSAQAPKTHRPEATPETVAYGYYWSEAKPVLRVASGDTIDVDTAHELTDGLPGAFATRSRTR